MRVAKRSSLLSEQATNSLRQAIIEGEFETGQALAEAAIASQLGVSRGPLREALRRLAVEGLVEAGARGFVVVGISVREIDEIYSLRAILERFALTTAVGRATSVDRKQLRSLIIEMENAVNRNEPLLFSEIDEQFHTLFYSITRHRRLIGMWQQLAPSVRLLLDATNSADRDLAGALDHHRALLEAFEAGDSRRLIRQLDSHLKHSRELVGLAWDIHKTTGSK